MNISKFYAAKRQLETTIRLYFCAGDPVSIHTLAAASYNILKDINKKRGGSPLMVKEHFFEFVKEDRRKEMRVLMNTAENFFKHADHDHESKLDFDPDQSQILIYEACSVYRKLSGEYPPLFMLFQAWFMASYQDLFNLPEEQKRIVAAVQQDVRSLSREDYFNKLLPVVMKLST